MEKQKPDQKTLYLIILSIILLIVFTVGIGALGFVIATRLQNQNNVVDSSFDEIKTKCLAEPNGKWLEEYKECEYISEPLCRELSGTYNACGSACRHQRGEVFCTEQCVQICSFSSTSNDTSILQDDRQNIVVDVVNGAELSSFISTFGENETALDFLKRLQLENSGFTFETQSFSFGEMITGVNGVRADENTHFWAFKVNGLDSEVGVSQYKTKAGDKLDFVLTDIQ